MIADNKENESNIEQNISIGVTAAFKPRVFDRVEFIENNILPFLT